jgi:hypothetical protein
MQGRPPDKEENQRPLGPPYTYFGYDDFGHTSCANCIDDITHPTLKKSIGSRSSAIVRRDESFNRESMARAKRPASAPAARGGA